MDIKSAYVAFALGLAVGIVAPIALSNPILTATFLVVSLVVIVVSAIAAVRAARRTTVCHGTERAERET